MYFQTLVVRILRYINDASILIVNNNTRATDEALQIAIDYINEHFKNNITLDDMAELLHLNPSYFSKKFKSANGLGFKEYLNNVRINHSEKLLLETGMSITEIAFECGYDNSNYYGDAFKKVNGVSPSTFRKLKGNIVDRWYEIQEIKAAQILLFLCSLFILIYNFITCYSSADSSAFS